MFVEYLSINSLGKRLGFNHAMDCDEDFSNKSLADWKMENDDAPIFRYIYKEFQPSRHLEFGTWEGTGSLYCLEESNATVWSINLIDGEKKSNGQWTYSDNLTTLISKGTQFNDGTPITCDSNLYHSKKLSLSLKQIIKRMLLLYSEKVYDKISRWGGQSPEKLWYQTDSLGFIGNRVHQASMGHRFCQVYCDSKDWDISNYPDDFFDTILIDGGHTEDVIINDTLKAIKLVRRGGIVMWHDFCPLSDVYEHIPTVKNVVQTIHHNFAWISSEFSDLFWIKPSFILIGVKK